MNQKICLYFTAVSAYSISSESIYIHPRHYSTLFIRTAFHITKNLRFLVYHFINTKRAMLFWIVSKIKTKLRISGVYVTDMWDEICKNSKFKNSEWLGEKMKNCRSRGNFSSWDDFSEKFPQLTRPLYSLTIQFLKVTKSFYISLSSKIST